MGHSKSQHLFGSQGRRNRLRRSTTRATKSHGKGCGSRWAKNRAISVFNPLQSSNVFTFSQTIWGAQNTLLRSLCPQTVLLLCGIVFHLAAWKPHTLDMTCCRGLAGFTHTLTTLIPHHDSLHPTFYLEKLSFFLKNMF